jgi:hypothetical protein
MTDCNRPKTLVDDGRPLGHCLKQDSMGNVLNHADALLSDSILPVTLYSEKRQSLQV